MRSAVVGILSVGIYLFSAVAQGQDPVRVAAASKPDTAATTYLLRYKFHAGEEIRTRVSQLATIETTISGTTQTSQMISLSTKVWRVKNIDPQGMITFEHSVDDVDMRNEMSGRQEVRYNSQTDKKPPVGYEDIAKSLRTPLAIVTIDSTGAILARDERHRAVIDASGTVLVLPLPKGPVAIEAEWTLPNDVIVPLEDGSLKKIKTRLHYELESVRDGIAKIAVETQVLTPVDDPKIRAQLIQRLWRGHIRFDIDAGCMVSQRTDLDERVLAFSGPDSSMHYVARFTEELLPPAATKTAAQ